MALVHPLSVVDSRAELGEGVEIGPYCLVEGKVVIGAGTKLLHHVTVRGPLEMGKGNVVHPYVCLGGAPQHRGFDAGTDGAGAVIGDENVFREGFTLSRAAGESPTRVGNRNYFMANTHVGHDAVVGDDCNLANSACLGGHVTLGNSVFLGGNSGVHQHCRVGRMAMLSAGMILVQDLAPFCTSYNSRTVGSLNLVALRRAGMREHIGALNRAFDELFRNHHAMPVALAMIEERDGGDAMVREFVAFARGTKRGMTSCEAGEERGIAVVPAVVEIAVEVPVERKLARRGKTRALRQG